MRSTPGFFMHNLFRAWALACVLAWMVGAAVAAPILPIAREAHDEAGTSVDLRGHLEYAIVPAGEVDPDKLWFATDMPFKAMRAGQRLNIPAGYMLLARIQLNVPQLRDPDYLQFPSSRLDRVRLWSRSEGLAWQHGEAGDRVALAKWPFAGPFPAFELPDGNDRLQLVMAIEQRGTLNVPIEWVPDTAFRSSRMNHSFTFGAIAGLAAALALVCALTALLFRRIEFGALCGYTLLTGLSLAASNGYAGVYLWPQLPQWNDPSKGFFGMLLVCALLPLIARVLRLDVHRPVWWKASWRWAMAGLAYALLQVWVLPAEWRTVANQLYVLATLGVAAALALHGVRRADAMSRLTLAAVALIGVGTVLNYADQLDLVNELGLHVLNAACRIGFVVLMLCVAVQRYRFGRDVLSRQMVGTNRDALTGLRNRSGLQQELARAALLADAGEAMDAGVIICELRRLDNLRAEFGDEMCERILVRFAYILQRCLHGHEALVSRLGYGRFAAVVLGAPGREQMQSIATAILSRMLAQTDLPDAVREIKLRIAVTSRPLGGLKLEEAEALVDREAVNTTDSRTIRWV